MPSSRCKFDGCDDWAATNKDYCFAHLPDSSSARQNVHDLSADPAQVRETSSQPICLDKKQQKSGLYETDGLIRYCSHTTSFASKIHREPVEWLNEL